MHPALEALGHLGNLFADVPGGMHLIDQLVNSEDMGNQDVDHLRQFEQPQGRLLQRQPSSQGGESGSESRKLCRKRIIYSCAGLSDSNQHRI